MDATAPLEWLRYFEAREGRPLRVLHVGNIANNAYLNAKFLRSAGVDAHVVCVDYEHVMATPEWEELELLHGHGDDFHPTFSKQDLGEYRRPSWFVSGSLRSCAEQIGAIWGEGAPVPRETRLSQRAVAVARRVFGSRVASLAHQAATEPGRFVHNVRRKMGALVRLPRRQPGTGAGVANAATAAILANTKAHPISRHPLIAEFASLFPQRPDRLTDEDIAPFQWAVQHVERMFRNYDIVQCYATDPTLALLAGKRPYVAFEHGTLRVCTMGDFPLHRLTALAYRKADHVFITNGDCLAYAKRLNIDAYSPMIHPIDVEQHRRDYGDAIAALRREFAADVILFCPTRHDWEIKGTDRFIRALPLVKQRVSGRVKLILVRWGQQISDSVALIRELGCANDVIWQTTMSRVSMIKHMRAADVVFDQMVLPVFGATAPQAIAAGKPVVASYVPEQTQWIIPEPAPTLCAFTPEDVASAVVTALDPLWRAEYEHRARQWIDRYHHPRTVISRHLNVYRDLIERYGGNASSMPDGTGFRPHRSASSDEIG